MWTYAIRLYRYLEAPDEPGVYEIGFLRGDWFYPKYLGKAEASIRDRLSKHYRMKGNTGVSEYLEYIKWKKKLAEEGLLKRGAAVPRDNLYVRWSQVSDPKAKEASLMRSFDYEWNERVES